MASRGLAIIFLMLPQLAHCLTGSIPLNSELSAREDQSWISENGTFAFGFTSAGRGDQLLLAIWYAKLPGDPTIVWSPNRDLPVGREAVAKLDQLGNLVLVDGNTTVWISNTSSLGVEYGVMSDSGSFILYNRSSSNRQVAWQSFWHPSDTLLPGQPLFVSLELTSPKSSLGLYSLKMLQQRTSLSLALTYISPEPYFSSLGSHANYSYWSSPEISNATGDVIAQLFESGSFGIRYGTSSTGTMYVHKNDSAGNQSILRRIAIGMDGNLRLYRWDNQWVVEWSAVPNPCLVAGICGSGVCSMDNSKSNAICTCLPGTSPVGSGIKGCLSSSIPSPQGNCSGTRNRSIRMETMPQTNYYFSGASTISNYSSVSRGSECAELCLADCNCVASVYGLLEAETCCWTLRSMVFGGLQDPSSTLYVKLGMNSSRTQEQGPPGEGSNGPTSDSPRSGVLLPLLLCVSVLVVLLCLLLCYIIRRRRMQQRQGMISGSLSLPGCPVHFSFHDLQTATCNFSRLLGTGGSGSVYKGTLRDGTLVAVKKLDKMLPHGEREFITEVTTIGSMHHMNLVSLCGFCSERSHRLLVYEYMSNGSLDKWIFPSNNGQERLLDWQTRFSIAIAIAQGIAYFHEQCRNRIIHCDIKPENILLDEKFCPKVSDFGLAKLMSREHSHVITMVRGTRGYLAPEWVSNRPITVKADVYSYGMLLLEIVGGRRNLDMSLDQEEFFYPGWAFKEMMNGTPLKASDKRLNEGVPDEEEFLRALQVALWCIQEDAWMRPSMGEVVKMLEGSVEINVPPMPQIVLELVAEGLHSVYRAMKGDCFSRPTTSSAITCQRSSKATYSYSTMSPR
ncbi:G-type lectin S-receptor-like serine/threonine-protein kinase [Cocos nucifera]|uniref:Receptor-like serine/threonine-protein kinase n=1 Tax=Cocos nucifera TaxID=13894 RepID=A0A8K0IAV5_COCNU|nr:G-type lectin S-receptor-like serine/threonine-protein kinase [Cocos nucifera]